MTGEDDDDDVRDVLAGDDSALDDDEAAHAAWIGRGLPPALAADVDAAAELFGQTFPDYTPSMLRLRAWRTVVLHEVVDAAFRQPWSAEHREGAREAVGEVAELLASLPVPDVRP